MRETTLNEAFRDLRHRYPGWHVAIYVGGTEWPHWMLRISRMLVVDGGISSETYHSDQYVPLGCGTYSEALEHLGAAVRAGLSAEAMMEATR